MTIFFLLITAAALLLLFLITEKNKKVLTISIVWLAIIAALALSGFFKDFSSPFPRLFLGVMPTIIALLYLSKSIVPSEKNYSLLLCLHTLRIPVEISIFLWYTHKLVPKIMTFEGANFDILIGISAVIILWMNWRNKKVNATVLKIWNVIGIIFLLNIVVIALLSTPIKFQQFGFDQPNIAVLQFPFVFLPTFIVPLVLMSHIALLRKNFSSC